jgi:aminoglycoside phosphotransferase (APT) family kinase protein
VTIDPAQSHPAQTDPARTDPGRAGELAEEQVEATAAGRVREILRVAWPGVEVGEPAPLTGGYWATMWRVPVHGQPPGVAGEVVVRLAPHRSMGAKDAAVQRAVAAQGFPTPAVHLTQPDEVSGGWWSVMDFCPGAPLLAGLDGLAALARAPGLLRHLPRQLASTMAAVHRLDPEPVTAAVRAATTEVAWSVTDLVERFGEGSAAIGRDDVTRALDRLAADPPRRTSAVVCHGDLHPFNILDRGDRLVTLDWTGALVADPCFDVAFTELVLANPPLVLPRALVPAGRRAGRLVARRFVAGYTRAAPAASLEPLAWFRALHCARVVLEVANLRAAHGPDARHPLIAVSPAAAAHLEAATGVTVQAG